MSVCHVSYQSAHVFKRQFSLVFVLYSLDNGMEDKNKQDSTTLSEDNYPTLAHLINEMLFLLYSTNVRALIMHLICT